MLPVAEQQLVRGIGLAELRELHEPILVPDEHLLHGTGMGVIGHDVESRREEIDRTSEQPEIEKDCRARNRCGDHTWSVAPIVRPDVMDRNRGVVQVS